MMYFIGIEGGGTKSHGVLFDENGKFIFQISGPATNVWSVGLPLALDRMEKLIRYLYSKVNGGDQIVAGLAISGASKTDVALEIKSQLQKRCTFLSSAYVCSDTFGSLHTCTNEGIVLIAGTGSSCFYIKNTECIQRCGGWGHLIGDEGSAYWIAQMAIKRVFDNHDHMPHCLTNTDRVLQIMQEYFQIHDPIDILPHFHDKFKKEFIAGLCEKLALLATSENNECAKMCFTAAGYQLARHVIAIEGSMSDEIKVQAGGPKIIIIGSVWKSWPLLKDSFIQTVKNGSNLKEVTLLEPLVPGSYGAARLGALHASSVLSMNLDNNYKTYEIIDLT